MHAISNPLSPGNGDLRAVLSGHLCASLHVGHARRIRPVFDYRITDLEAHIKTNKNKIATAFREKYETAIIFKWNSFLFLHASDLISRW